MPTYDGGRHELGQNFLTDPRTIAAIVDLVAQTSGPIVEIGPGRGALTFGLQDLGRPLTAIEVDPRHARWLAGRAGSNTQVVTNDFLRYRLPATPHVVVGNLPFHQTTAILRRILHAPGWTDAVLIVQWEVARRRAGVGGASMMTAQWWPWIDFSVERRVPASAFTPRPQVDAGVLAMSRRSSPLLEAEHRTAYRSFVHAVFTGRGHGLSEILARVCDRRSARPVQSWLSRQPFPRAPLPKDLSPQQWADLYSLAVGPHSPGRGHRSTSYT